MDNRVFLINVDPTTHETSYQDNMENRDVIKFQSVMRSYGLRPNGAILLSLNLYANQIDVLLETVDCHCNEVSLFPVDTQGQMEMLMLSASKVIMDDAKAITLPTIAPRFVNTRIASALMAFVRNMLYVSSIFTKLTFC